MPIIKHKGALLRLPVLPFLSRSVLPISRFIGEPPSLKAFQCFKCSLTISHLAIVVSEIKLTQIAMQMLAANVVIHAVDTALE
jgi:hypothetical protein